MSLSASAVGSGESEAAFYRDLVLKAQEELGADSADLFLGEETGGVVLVASTLAADFAGRCRVGPGLGLVGAAMNSGEMQVVERGLSADPRFVEYPGVHEAPFESALVGALAHPVRGALIARRREAWTPTTQERECFQRVLTQTSTALRAFETGRRLGAESSRLGQLSEVAQTIAGSPYVEEVLQLLVNLTAQQFNYKVCTVRLLDERTNELVLRATQSPVRAYRRKPAIKLGESIAGRAIVEKRTILVYDVQEEKEYVGHDLAAEQGLRSMACVPLTIQDRAVGVLTCYTDQFRWFAPDEVKALETLAKQAAVSIEHAKLQVRSTLMQEMNHRVKNNLQQVASLLRLQLRQRPAKSSEEAIADTLSRILAIAAVHELLTREDLDYVGLRSIADALVSTQQASLMKPGAKIDVEVRGDDVRLNMTQATQVSLVLNELVQNAVEHGFANADRGFLRVFIERASGEVRVQVENDGRPLPPGFDPEKSGQLGLQIVENLVRALGGSFSLSSAGDVTRAELRFNPQGSE